MISLWFFCSGARAPKTGGFWPGQFGRGHAGADLITVKGAAPDKPPTASFYERCGASGPDNYTAERLRVCLSIMGLLQLTGAGA